MNGFAFLRFSINPVSTSIIFCQSKGYINSPAPFSLLAKTTPKSFLAVLK